ncbi:hypothetical protein VitviT2T_028157 [Vitis vinifera]|uniref:Retrotransposon gag domain-containing protein n=1 Tax=Vitis vinifera TaxID=29760 RepID=A0ABY9DU37_VITVI|nr:hypothetical protein VitviT2T_028157 [Vitis vinifera]
MWRALLSGLPHGEAHGTREHHTRTIGCVVRIIDFRRHPMGSCNLCMPYWIRDQEGRLVRIENPQDTELDICVNIMDPPQEDQNSQHGQGDNPNAYLSMMDRMHPPRMSAPSCIVPPLEQLIIRPYIVPLLPNFHGMESENPYAHIKEFEEVCNTFREGGASIDLMRLKLFPFTLKDKAKIWLNSLRPRSIRNWVDLQAEFLKKIFPTHRTNGLKRQISNFSAQENEKFYECWERYMEAINACPHHGFDTWLLVSYFYDGMLITTQKVLFYTFNSLCFKHSCVVVLHLYPNWHVKDIAMTSNHICG